MLMAVPEGVYVINQALKCAMKLSEGMGGNPLGLSQGAHEPLELSGA